MSDQQKQQSWKTDLIEQALKARRSAYAPYSGYKVGAALLCKDGSVYTGCNVENASYGAANCGERTAVFKAVSEGQREFTAIAITGGRDDGEMDFAYPCGICRQVLREFTDPERFTVLVGKSTEDYREMTLEALLPSSFGPDNLGL